MEQKKLARSQGGFTLIEIIAVLVILGILAAVAVPRFINLQDDAAERTVQAVAANMGSASAINYAAALLGSDDAESFTNCDEIGALLDGGIPDGYAVNDSSLGSSLGDTAECTVTHTDSTHTATFTGHFVPAGDEGTNE